MRRHLGLVAACLCCASAAYAFDMPTRKAGEWEITMQFASRNLPARTMRQCVDQATDKLMNSNYGGQGDCTKRDISKVGDTMVVELGVYIRPGDDDLACGGQRQFRQRLYGRRDLDAHGRPVHSGHGDGPADAHEDRGQMGRALRRRRAAR